MSNDEEPRLRLVSGHRFVLQTKGRLVDDYRCERCGAHGSMQYMQGFVYWGGCPGTMDAYWAKKEAESAEILAKAKRMSA